MPGNQTHQGKFFPVFRFSFELSALPQAANSSRQDYYFARSFNTSNVQI